MRSVFRITGSEAVKFWALCENYADEPRLINDEKYGMLHAYLRNWPSMTNNEVLIFMRRWLDVDQQSFNCAASIWLQQKRPCPAKTQQPFFSRTNESAR